jgi:hypothetical protein
VIGIAVPKNKSDSDFGSANDGSVIIGSLLACIEEIGVNR